MVVAPQRRSRAGQSAFVRTFDPAPIVQSFRGAPQRAACSTGWLKTSSSFASSAGYHFLNRRKDIQTRRTIDPTFCANPQQIAELMTSLHGSLLSALSSSGCQVIADRLTTREGVQIVYRRGAYIQELLWFVFRRNCLAKATATSR